MQLNLYDLPLLHQTLEQLGAADWLFTLQHFMDQGGPVLWWLAAVVLASWLLAMERALFLLFSYPKQQQQWASLWQARTEHNSWYARAQRERWLSEAYLALNQNLSLLKVLVSICPMLGLLGTVTGMISVFDIMATVGSSQPRLMASGISMATLPTMAGMVAALSGLFVHARLSAACQRRERQLEKLLRSKA